MLFFRLFDSFNFLVFSKIGYIGYFLGKELPLYGQPEQEASQTLSLHRSLEHFRVMF